MISSAFLTSKQQAKLAIGFFVGLVIVAGLVILFTPPISDQVVLVPNQSASLVNGDISISITYLGDGDWKCKSSVAVACDQNAIIFRSQEIIQLRQQNDDGKDSGHIYLTNDWIGTLSN